MYLRLEKGTIPHRTEGGGWGGVSSVMSRHKQLTPGRFEISSAAHCLTLPLYLYQI